MPSASWLGPAILVIFALAYALVFAEEKLHLRKSQPVMIAAGAIWILVATWHYLNGNGPEVTEKLRHVLLEYAEMFLFLLSAMSFVNTMVERNVFEFLRTRLVAAKLSLRGIFWVTGAFAFFLSPVADNLTTALVMGAVVASTLGHRKQLVSGAMVNVVVAANAGGAFSPFGDITTLMIWQKGAVQFDQFFHLFLPALVNWLVPAALIAWTLPKEKVVASGKIAKVRQGGFVVVGLFLGTVATTVFLDHVLHLPPFLGMMTGLGALKLYGHFLNRAETRLLAKTSIEASLPANADDAALSLRKPFDVFGILEKVEWDTLLFFYGIMLCVGGIGAIGYLHRLSSFLYVDLGATPANVAVGVLSAIVDNIPLTFAVLTMNPSMDLGQWLLITLTAGVGGSLLSIGSAAGVALMGFSKGQYTFLGHLKWIWAVGIGFVASVATHLLVNRALFEAP